MVQVRLWNNVPAQDGMVCWTRKNWTEQGPRRSRGAERFGRSDHMTVKGCGDKVAGNLRIYQKHEAGRVPGTSGSQRYDNMFYKMRCPAVG